MKILLRVIVLSLLILMAGCGMEKSPSKKPQQVTHGKEQVQINPEIAEKVKQTAKTVRGVEESAAVVVNKEISIAIKVSGFNRLRLKSIKEEVHKKIKELNKGYTVHVTSDKKVFRQLQQIEKEINGSHRNSLSDIQKKVNKINKDMQG